MPRRDLCLIMLCSWCICILIHILICTSYSYTYSYVLNTLLCTDMYLHTGNMETHIAESFCFTNCQATLNVCCLLLLQPYLWVPEQGKCCGQVAEWEVWNIPAALQWEWHREQPESWCLWIPDCGCDRDKPCNRWLGRRCTVSSSECDLTYAGWCQYVSIILQVAPKCTM